MSYSKQNFSKGQTLTADHLNNIEDGIVNLEKQIPTDSTNYWAGKKMVICGDSVAAGSHVTLETCFASVVGKKLGMASVTNYAIGGSTIGKRSGDYDEAYYDKSKWDAAVSAGTLDTSKKYLVNGGGTGRSWQIYSYNGSSWVGGGTTSTKAGRTPVCDRVLAMDDDADVIMIHAGSNDWYYEWCPLGNFEDSTYRKLGYSGEWGEEEVKVGELDTTTNLIESPDVEFISVGGPTASGSTSMGTSEAFYTYKNIPVTGNRAVKVPYGRAAWWLDADKDDIKFVNFTNEGTDYTLTAPANAVYLIVCFKYEEVQPENAVVYMSVAVEGEEESVEVSGKSSNEPCETFYDAMHKTCKQILNKWKNKDVIFITPRKRRQYTGKSNGTWDCCYPEDANSEGKTIKDYRDAMIEVCEYYSIPYVDLYANSGLNAHIDPSMYADTNGIAVHPTEEGHERMASIIAAQMRAMRM